MKNKTLTRLIAGVGLGILAAVFIWVLAKEIAPGLFYAYEARTYDWRVKKSVQDIPEQSIEDIVIVDIDGRSVSKLGKFTQWDRSYYPRVINYLKEGGAAAIGLDILFDKDLRNPDADAQFVQAVRDAGIVYNAVYFAAADSANWRYVMSREPERFDFSRVTYDFPPEIIQNLRHEQRFESEFMDLLNAGKAVGHVNFEGDNDGVVRKIYLFTSFNNHAYPSLAFRMYLDLMGADNVTFADQNTLRISGAGNTLAEIPVDENGNMDISYGGGFKAFRYISFYDVLEQRIPKEFFENKIILVGTSLPGLFDLRSVPFQAAFPGVEIHANILYTLISQNFVRELNKPMAFSLMAALGVLAGLITIWLTPLWSIIVIFGLIVIHTFTAAVFYLDSRYWIEIVNPVLTLIVTFSAVYIYRYVTEEKGKKFIKDTFSHFVTQSVVDELLANPEKIKLGGEKKICTVLFSDVAGFTTISEQLSPDALVTLLNEYLTEMTNIVFKYDGMLDKYEGDAIMAVFGAPVSHGNDAIHSCAAALEMQQQLVQLRKRWAEQGKPQLHVRVGLNTGPMVVGNMGSESRFDYTVMGDSVNLGARLEGANKQYGTAIMIGEATWQMAKDGIIARELDLLRVKGKNEPVRVYELIALAETGISDEKTQVLNYFHKGFENYLAQNWDWALNYFKQALSIDANDSPSLTYVKRCEQFLANPPGENWDGVFTMRTK